MDKLVNYATIIVEKLQAYAAIPPKNAPGLRQQVLADKEGHHYQLLSIGWQEDTFVFRVIFHFDIIDGKVWLQRNSSDILIADELVAAGIPREDIVLGFQPDYVRPHTGFAVG